MQVKIKRIDKSIPLPVYETQGSVGFDLLTRTEMSILPQTIGLVPANIIVEVPYGYVLVLASRSSTPLKKSLSTPHGIGIIDHDYCGEKDELKVQIYNFSNTTVTIAKGDKIAQGLFLPVQKVDFIEVDEMQTESRGGFGSTG